MYLLSWSGTTKRIKMLENNCQKSVINCKIGFIGAGNMAQAIVTGMLEAGKFLYKVSDLGLVLFEPHSINVYVRM